MAVLSSKKALIINLIKLVEKPMKMLITLEKYSPSIPCRKR